ncbi:MAG: THUMP domain-containing protein [Thermoproteota archaeon]
MLVFPPASVSKQSLAKAAKKSDAKRITFEGPCFIYRAYDSKIALDMAKIAKSDNVVTAKQVSNRFSDIIDAIVETGTETILPGEKFYVKTILASKKDCVERDIEFASAGALVEKLARINALPARSEHEADRVILVVVGKRQAYVGVR